MTSKSSSPTAKLLRNSRFFSLPKPLPLPVSRAQQYQRNIRNSDTATLPYPIHQAVTTTPNAHTQGNWGLKRPLPTRITQNTSTPIVRVNAMDTREAVTDYASAADHAITLQKLHELHLPVTVPASRLGRRHQSRPLDPFQPALDNIDPKVVGPERNNVRWKFRGPSLARISQGDFDIYITKELRKRKLEFLGFLKQRARQYLISERRFAAQTAGRNHATDEEAAADISNEDVDSVLRKWQADMLASGSSGTMIHTLISDFLDLPDKTGPVALIDAYRSPDDTPSPTHPSAGVSYLRSDAFLSNHPVLGPQANQPPVEARVLGTAMNFDPPIFTGSSHERIGVAGVVGPAPRVTSSARIRSSGTPADASSSGKGSREGSQSIGVMTPAGNRIWVAPTKLEIDSTGRLALASQNPNPIAVNIHTGNTAKTSPSTSNTRSSSAQQMDARKLLQLGRNRSRNVRSSDSTADFMRNLLG